MIAIASDHVGLSLKAAVMEQLDELKLEYRDYWTFSAERCNYPEYELLAASYAANRTLRCCRVSITTQICWLWAAGWLEWTWLK